MVKISSKTVIIKNNQKFLTGDCIESLLKQNFGQIVRWAIIDVYDDNLKIAFSYIKQT